MELELGLKVTRTREDVSSSVDFRFSKDPFGPLVLSRETDSWFIIIIHLKGFKKEGIEIDINKEGDRITISGRKPVEEMVMIRWMAWRKEVEMRAFRKVFLIPDVVDLDKIKARFDDDDATLTITMPKRVRGISGFNLEQEEEEEEEGVEFGDVSEVENREEVEDENEEREESDEHSEVQGEEYFGEMVEDEERESQVYEGEEEGFSGGVDETQIEDDDLEEIQQTGQQELADSDIESKDIFLKKLPDIMEQEDNQEVMEKKVSEEIKNEEIGSGVTEEIEEQESDEDSGLKELPDMIEQEDNQRVREQKVSEDVRSGDTGSEAVEETEEQESDGNNGSDTKSKDSGLTKLPDIIEQEDNQKVKEQKVSEETKSGDNEESIMSQKKVSGEPEEIEEEEESHEDNSLKNHPDIIEQEDDREVMDQKVSEETKNGDIRSGVTEDIEQESDEYSGLKKLPDNKEHEDNREVVEQKVSEETKSDDNGSGATEKIQEQESHEDSGLEKLSDIMEQEENQEVMEQKVSEETKSDDNGSGATEEIQEQESHEDSGLEKLPDIMEQEENQEVMEQRVSEEIKSEGIGSGVVEEIQEQESDEIGRTSEKKRTDGDDYNDSLRKAQGIEEPERHNEKSKIQEMVEEDTSGQEKINNKEAKREFDGKETQTEDDNLEKSQQTDEEETVGRHEFADSVTESEERSSLRKLPYIIEKENKQDEMEKKDSQAEATSDGFGSRALEEIDKQEPHEQVDGTSKGREKADDDGLRKVQGIEEPERRNEVRKIQEMVEGDRKKDAGAEMGEGFTPNVERTTVAAEDDVAETETKAEELESEKIEADKIDKKNELVDKVSLIKLQENEEKHSKGKENIKELMEEKTAEAETNIANDASKPEVGSVLKTDDEGKEKKKSKKMDTEKQGADEVDKIHKPVEKKVEEDANVRAKCEDNILTNLQENEEKYSKGRKPQDKQENIKELVEEKAIEAETNIVNDALKPVQETEPDVGTLGEVMEQKVSEETKSDYIGSGALEEIDEQESNEDSGLEKLPDIIEKVMEQRVSEETKSGDIGSGAVEEMEEEQESDEVGGTSKSKAMEKQAAPDGDDGAGLRKAHETEEPEKHHEERKITGGQEKNAKEESNGKETQTEDEDLEKSQQIDEQGKILESAEEKNVGQQVFTDSVTEIDDSSSLRKPPHILDVMDQKDSQEETRSDDFGSGAFEDIEKQEPHEQLDGTSKGRAKAGDDGLIKAQGIEEPDRRNEVSKVKETSDHEKRKIVQMETKSKDPKEDVDADLGGGFTQNTETTRVVAEDNIAETETKSEELESRKQETDKVEKKHELVEKKEEEEDHTKVRRESEDGRSLIEPQEVEEQLSQGQKQHEKPEKTKEFVEEKTPEAEESIENDTPKQIQEKTNDAESRKPHETIKQQELDEWERCEKESKTQELVKRKTNDEEKEEKDIEETVTKEQDSYRPKVLGEEEKVQEKTDFSKNGKVKEGEEIQEKKTELGHDDISRKSGDSDAKEEVDAKMGKGFAPSIAETETKPEDIESEKLGANEVDKIHKLVEKKEEEDDNVRAKGEDRSLIKLQETEESHSKGRKRQEKQETIKELVEEKAPEAEKNVFNDVPKPVQEIKPEVGTLGETYDTEKEATEKKKIASLEVRKRDAREETDVKMGVPKVAETEKKPEIFESDQLKADEVDRIHELVEKKKEEEEEKNAKVGTESEEQQSQGQRKHDKQAKIEELVEEKTPVEQTNIGNDHLKPVEERGEGKEKIQRLIQEETKKQPEEHKENMAKKGEKIGDAGSREVQEIISQHELDEPERCEKERKTLEVVKSITNDKDEEEKETEERKSKEQESYRPKILGEQEKIKELTEEKMKFSRKVEEDEDIAEKKTELSDDDIDAMKGQEEKEKNQESVQEEKVSLQVRYRDANEEVDAQLSVPNIAETETKLEEFESDQLKSGKVDKIHELVEKKKEDENEKNAKVGTQSEDISSIKPQEVREQQFQGQKKHPKQEKIHELVEEKTPEAEEHKEKMVETEKKFNSAGSGEVQDLDEAERFEKESKILEVVESKTSDEKKEEKEIEEKKTEKFGDDDRQISRRDSDSKEEVDVEKGKGFKTNISEAETKGEEFESQRLEPDENEDIHDVVEKKEEEEKNSKVRKEREDRRSLLEIQENEKQHSKRQKRQEKTAETETNIPTPVQAPNTSETETKPEELEFYKLEPDEVDELVDKKEEEEENNAKMKGQSEDSNLSKELQETKEQQQDKTKELVEVKTPAAETTQIPKPAQEIEEPEVGALETCEEEKRAETDTETMKQEPYRPKVFGGDDLHVSRRVGDTGQGDLDAKEEVDPERSEGSTPKILETEKKAEEFESDTVEEVEEEMIHEQGLDKAERCEKESKTQEVVKSKTNDEDKKKLAETETTEHEKIQELAEEKTGFLKNGEVKVEGETAEKKTEFGSDDDQISREVGDTVQRDSDAKEEDDAETGERLTPSITEAEKKADELVEKKKEENAKGRKKSEEDSSLKGLQEKIFQGPNRHSKQEKIKEVEEKQEAETVQETAKPKVEPLETCEEKVFSETETKDQESYRPKILEGEDKIQELAEEKMKFSRKVEEEGDTAEKKKELCDDDLSRKARDSDAMKGKEIEKEKIQELALKEKVSDGGKKIVAEGKAENDKSRKAQETDEKKSHEEDEPGNKVKELIGGETIGQGEVKGVESEKKRTEVDKKFKDTARDEAQEVERKVPGDKFQELQEDITTFQNEKEEEKEDEADIPERGTGMVEQELVNLKRQMEQEPGEKTQEPVDENNNNCKEEEPETKADDIIRKVEGPKEQELSEPKKNHVRKIKEVVEEKIAEPETKDEYGGLSEVHGSEEVELHEPSGQERGEEEKEKVVEYMRITEKESSPTAQEIKDQRPDKDSHEKQSKTQDLVEAGHNETEEHTLKRVEEIEKEEPDGLKRSVVQDKKQETEESEISRATEEKEIVESITETEDVSLREDQGAEGPEMSKPYKRLEEDKIQESVEMGKSGYKEKVKKQNGIDISRIQEPGNPNLDEHERHGEQTNILQGEDKIQEPVDMGTHDHSEKVKKQDGDDVPQSVEEEKEEKMAEQEGKVEDDSSDKFHEIEERKSYKDWTHETRWRSNDEATDPKKSEEKEKTRAVEEKDIVERKTRTRDGNLRKVQDDAEQELSNPYKPQEEDKVQESVERGTSDYREEVKKQDGNDTLRSKEIGKPSIIIEEAPAKAGQSDHKEEEKVITKAKVKAEEDTSEKIQEIEKQKSGELQKSLVQDKLQETEEKEEIRAMEENETVKRRTKSEAESSEPHKRRDEDNIKELVEMKTSDYREKVKTQDGDDILRSQESEKLVLLEEEATGPKDEHTGRKEEPKEEEIYERVAQTETKVQDETKKEVEKNQKEEENSLDDSVRKTQESEKEESHEPKIHIVQDLVEEETKDQEDEVAEEAAAVEENYDDDSSQILQTIEEHEDGKEQTNDPGVEEAYEDLTQEERGMMKDLVKEEALDLKHTGGGHNDHNKEEQHEENLIPKAEVEAEEDSSEQESGDLQRSLGQDKKQETEEKEKARSMEENETVEGRTKTEDGSLRKVQEGEDPEKLDIVQDIVEDKKWDQEDDRVGEAEAVVVSNEKDSSRKFQTTGGEELREHEEQDKIPATSDPRVKEEDGERVAEKETKMEKIHVQEPEGKTENENSRRGQKGKQKKNDETRSDDDIVRKVVKTKVQESNVRKDQEPGGMIEEPERKEASDDGAKLDTDEDSLIKGQEFIEKESSNVPKRRPVGQENIQQLREEPYELLENEEHEKIPEPIVEGTKYQREEEKRVEDREVEEMKRKAEDVSSREVQNIKAQEEDGLEKHRELSGLKDQSVEEEKVDETGGYKEMLKKDSVEDTRQSQDVEEKRPNQTEQGNIQELVAEEEEEEQNEKAQRITQVDPKANDDSSKNNDIERSRGQEQKEDHQEVMETETRDQRKKEMEEKIVDKAVTRNECDSSRKNQEHEGEQLDKLEIRGEEETSGSLAKEETSNEEEENRGNRAESETTIKDDGFREEQLAIVLRHREQDKKQLVAEKDTSGKPKVKRNQETKSRDESSRKTGENEKQDSYEQKINKEEQDKKKLGPNYFRNEEDGKGDRETAEADGTRRLKEIEQREATKMVESHDHQDNITDLVEEKMNNQEKEEKKRMFMEVLAKSEDFESKEPERMRKQDKGSELVQERSTDIDEETKIKEKESSKTHQHIEKETGEEEILKEKESRETECEDGSSKKIQEIDKEASTEPRRDEERDKIQQENSETSEDDEEEELEVEVEDSEEDWDAEVIQEMDSDEDNDKLKKIRRIKLGFRLVGGSTLFMSLIVIVISIIRSKRKTKCYKF